MQSRLFFSQDSVITTSSTMYVADINSLNSLPSKWHFATATVNRERRFRALVLQNHPKSIRLFEHSKTNLT
jgi:hypothetical protein